MSDEPSEAELRLRLLRQIVAARGRWIPGLLSIDGMARGFDPDKVTDPRDLMNEEALHERGLEWIRQQTKQRGLSGLRITETDLEGRDLPAELKAAILAESEVKQQLLFLVPDEPARALPEPLVRLFSASGPDNAALRLLWSHAGGCVVEVECNLTAAQHDALPAIMRMPTPGQVEQALMALFDLVDSRPATPMEQQYFRTHM